MYPKGEAIEITETYLDDESECRAQRRCSTLHRPAAPRPSSTMADRVAVSTATLAVCSNPHRPRTRNASPKPRADALWGMRSLTTSPAVARLVGELVGLSCLLLSVMAHRPFSNANLEVDDQLSGTFGDVAPFNDPARLPKDLGLTEAHAAVDLRRNVRRQQHFEVS